MSTDSENIDLISRMVFEQEKEIALMRSNFSIVVHQNDAVLQVLSKLSKTSSDAAKKSSMAAESAFIAARHSKTLAVESLERSKLANSDTSSYDLAIKAAQAAVQAAVQAADATLESALTAALSSTLALDSLEGSLTSAEKQAFLANKLEAEEAARAAAAAAAAAAA